MGKDAGSGIPMMSVVDRISAVLDEAGHGDLLAGADAAGVEEALVGFGSVVSRVTALFADVVGEVERKGLHHGDGFRSAKTMVAHHARLSNADALNLANTARMFTHMPVTAAAARAGTIPTSHVHRLARAFANPRVRDGLAECDHLFAEYAVEFSYKGFDKLVTKAVDRIDEDGAADKAERCHRNRTASIKQQPDKSWLFKASFGCTQGARLAEVLDKFAKAEFDTDWEKAKAEHGDTVAHSQMDRTPSQRRADAVEQIFMRAAATMPGGDKPGFCGVLKIDQKTFEHWVQKFHGLKPDLLDPFDGFACCETLNGDPLDPAEAVAHILAGTFRRAVIDGKGVVTDLGPKRLFTGLSRLAVQLSADCCVWPGCDVRVSDCQIDHLDPHTKRADGRGGGRTNPGNGGPLCGSHNRHKEQGFQVWRDQTGVWITMRPDGTIIPNPPA